MIDTTTRKPLTVEAAEGGGAILDLPASQLEQVTALLDAHKVPYWVDEEFLSIDGGSEMALIIFSVRADPAMVQQLLDGIP